MKYTELHRLIKKMDGDFSMRKEAIISTKKMEKTSPPIPFHGAKEIGESLRKKIIKEMDLK